MLRRRKAPTDIPRAELAELAASSTWMYEWDLGDGLRTAVMGPELMSVHRTRLAIMEAVVRDALEHAGRRPAVLDLACSEGWFAHQLLEWGADRVIGIDIRQENIRRAELVRDHLGVDQRRLSFEVGDVFDLTLQRLGTFDVVLCLGLIYHLENPVGALRIARSLTRGVCVVESQLTEQVEPIRHGWGTISEYHEQAASWAAWYEPAELQEDHPIASHGGVISFIPNRAALLDGMTAAGFARVEPLDAHEGNPQYTEGHRLVVAGWSDLDADGLPKS
jgi:tRNA (mo5U34)-methyltransferase